MQNTEQKINPTMLSVIDVWESNSFIIPDYQRPYSWGPNEVGKLLEDIREFVEDSLEEIESPAENGAYFMGSIITVHGDNNEVEVIDGQQRLITFLLLFHAMCHELDLEDKQRKDLEGLIKNKGEWRIKSKIRQKKETESEWLERVLNGGKKCQGGQTRFQKNYDHIKKSIESWKQEGVSGKIVEALMSGRIQMLELRCCSVDDALTLFQTVNDRGKPLTDADIFKVKFLDIAKKSGGDKACEKFLKRWKDIEDPEHMFRVYMRISRARNNVTGKEIRLRKYMDDNHFGRAAKHPFAESWKEEIMPCIEKSDYIHKEQGVVRRGEGKDLIKSYWAILQSLPHKYWTYPVHIFLHQHTESWRWGKNGQTLKFNQSPNKLFEKYIVLLENTIRYFYIKAVTYRTVSAVKTATFKTCANIWGDGKAERWCVEAYRESIKDDDENLFKRRLDGEDLPSTQRGLALLGAVLNPEQDVAKIRDAIESKDGLDIEHILPQNHPGEPRKWLNRIGNLVPLESEINRSVKDKEFKDKRKGDENSKGYEDSVIQDVRDLISLKDWTKKEFDKRQKEILKRLKKFFEAPKTKAYLPAHNKLYKSRRRAKPQR